MKPKAMILKTASRVYMAVKAWSTLSMFLFQSVT